MILLLLTTLPLVMNSRYDGVPLAGLGLAMFGPPLEAFIAQRRLYRDWGKRLGFLPMLMMLGVGIAVSNTEAVIRGFSPVPVAFHRTPKYRVDETHGSGWEGSAYTVPVDYSLLIEIGLASYAALTSAAAFQTQPGLALFMILYLLGFTYVAGLSLWQAGATRLVHNRNRRLLELSEHKL
jgi:hypothetical protein